MKALPSMPPRWTLEHLVLITYEVLCKTMYLFEHCSISAKTRGKKRLYEFYISSWKMTTPLQFPLSPAPPLYSFLYSGVFADKI